MHSNTGEKWVMINELSLNGLLINEAGTEFEIGDYYSVPHGYAPIEYEGLLLFIPDEIFEKHFIKLSEYKKYYQLGDRIMVNANGNLGTYAIDNIEGDGNYVTLRLEED